MSEWIKSLQRILSGKSHAGKLLVFGAACIIIAGLMEYYLDTSVSGYLAVAGFFLIIWGYNDYSAQIKAERERKYK
jgi:uncharacterized membrane protein